MPVLVTAERELSAGPGVGHRFPRYTEVEVRSLAVYEEVNHVSLQS